MKNCSILLAIFLLFVSSCAEKLSKNCGYEKSHIREGCYSIGGHETHIHMGPMNDSSATLEEAYEDTMDSHGKTEIYREVNKKA